MNTKYIISLTALIALTGALSYGAAGDLNPETPIGSLALLYAEGSADQAPRILALASLDRKNLLQLALIGYKEPQRFPNLYEDAMNELSRQKEKFRQLLQQHNGDVQAALFDAAQNNKPWAIDYLAQNGADFNARDNNGYTPLMVAATHGHGAIIAQLIAARADLNAQDMYGGTALMKAAYKGHAPVVAQLLAAGANVDGKNNGANVDGKNNTDITALMEAAERGHEAVVAQLLAAGANVDKKNNNGETALMNAAKSGHGAVVAQLIAAGANVNEKNNYDWTALMWAARNGQEAILAQLIAAGADVNVKDKYGNTALSLAETVVTNDTYSQADRDGARAIVDLLIRGG